VALQGKLKAINIWFPHPIIFNSRLWWDLPPSCAGTLSPA
jgi:hypothetical protein